MSLVASKQLASATLRGLAATGVVPSGKLIYSTGADTFGTSDITAFGRGLIACVNAAAVIAAIGLGTLSTQNANAVAISGGDLTGINSLSMLSLAANTSGTKNFSDNAFYARPTANTTATFSGILSKITYDGTADMVGGGHLIGLWGYADINAPTRTVALSLAVEGKTLVRAGALTLGSSVHAGLEDVVAGASLSTWVGCNAQVSDNHGTVTTVVGHDFKVVEATVAITNAFALRAQDVTLARVTSYAGFYSLVTAKAGAHYQVLCAGSAKSAFAGPVRFGGVTDPTEAVDVTGNILVAGNLTLAGNARFWKADFTSAVSTRSFFQTTTLNGATTVGVMPNGTGTQAYLSLHNTSDTSNYSQLAIGADTSSHLINSTRGGTGAFNPIYIQMGGATRIAVFPSGRVGINETTDSGVSGNNLQVSNAGSCILSVKNSATPSQINVVADGTGTGITSVGAYPFRLLVNSVEAMRLHSATQNVSIGTTADDGLNKLQVNGSVSASTSYKVNNVQVLTARKTGWTVATGTALRSGFDTATATVTQVAQALKGLIDDLHSTAGHGLIGT